MTAPEDDNPTSKESTAGTRSISDAQTLDVQNPDSTDFDIVGSPAVTAHAISITDGGLRYRTEMEDDELALWTHGDGVTVSVAGGGSPDRHIESRVTMSPALARDLATLLTRFAEAAESGRALVYNHRDRGSDDE